MKALEKQERDVLRHMIAALAKAREVLGAVELQQLETLLHVAVEGQITQQEIGTKLKLTKAAASRNIDKLGVWLPGGKERGPGFVEAYDDPTNRRYKLVNITPQGVKFASGLAYACMGGRHA